MNGVMKKRQEYIHKRYTSTGSIDKYDIMKKFGIAKSTAQKDIKIYLDALA